MMVATTLVDTGDHFFYPDRYVQALGQRKQGHWTTTLCLQAKANAAEGAASEWAADALHKKNHEFSDSA
jgi:hypothetical protein